MVRKQIDYTWDEYIQGLEAGMICAFRVLNPQKTVC